MSLKKLLDAGLSVIGTKFDGRVRPMKDMSEATQKRNGYLGTDGFWTDRGYNRATSTDMNQMAKSNQAMAKRKVK